MPRPSLVLRACALLSAVAAGLAAAAPAHARGGEVGGTGATYYLNDAWSGEANHVVRFGVATDRTYAGDWNGDGGDTLAVRRGNRYLLTNALGGAAQTEFAYGRPGDVALVGDWDGDGVDTLAVRRGNQYFFTNRLTGGPAETVLAYGRADDEVLVGDWDGDGRDTLAVRRGNTFHFADRLAGGPASRVVAYGRAGDRVSAGDWDGDGIDTPAVRRGATYYVTDRFAPGEADRVLVYGRAGDSTLVGDWNGDGRDTLGVRRDSAPHASPAASWARDAYGTFPAARLGGTGSRDVALPQGATAGLLIASHEGTGAFRLSILEGGQVRDEPLHATGRYAGTTVFGLDPATRGRTLRVAATGAWTVTVQPMQAAPPLPSAGAGDGVFLHAGGARSVAVRHDGRAPFLVLQWSGATSGRNGVVAAADGAFSGAGTLAAGPSVVQVVAGGTWEIARR